MSIPADIKATIETLDKRIAKLARLRRELLEEFGGEPAAERPPDRNPLFDMPFEDPSEKSSKDKIEAYIDQYGPAFRREIVANSGVSEGTVSWALNDKKRFLRRADGRWERVRAKDSTTPNVA